MSTPTQLPPGAPISQEDQMIVKLIRSTAHHKFDQWTDAELLVSQSYLAEQFRPVRDLIAAQTAETERLKALTVTLTAERDDEKLKANCIAINCDLTRKERDQARAQVVTLRDALAAGPKAWSWFVNNPHALIAGIASMDAKMQNALDALASTSDLAGKTVIDADELDELRKAVAFYAGKLRSDGNGYEFEQETFTGERARAAMQASTAQENSK